MSTFFKQIEVNACKTHLNCFPLEPCFEYEQFEAWEGMLRRSFVCEIVTRGCRSALSQPHSGPSHQQVSHMGHLPNFTGC